jgi:fructokinase
MTADALPIVVGLGELLWDVFPDGRRPGGAPANVAFQANQLGCRGLIATRVGTDSDGEALLRELQNFGLDLSAVQRDQKHPTGTVTVTLIDGHPDYVIHENVAWDFLELNESLQNAVQRCAAVCFGTLAQRHPVTRETIHRALALASAGTLRIYDVNLRQSYYAADCIEASLRLASHVKLNDEEVQLLAPLLKLPNDEVEFGRAVLEKYGPGVVCITRGARGCTVLSRSEIHHVPGRAVKVADTVGAGDAFTAGLISSQLRGWPLALCAEFANRVGAMVASRAGAMPDLQREFSQLLQQYDPGP